MKFISIINVSGMHLESRNSHHFWAVSTERSWNRRILCPSNCHRFFFHTECIHLFHQHICGDVRKMYNIKKKKSIKATFSILKPKNPLKFWLAFFLPPPNPAAL